MAECHARIWLEVPMIETFGILGFVALAVGMTLRPSAPAENCDPAGSRAQTLQRAERRGTLAVAVSGFGIAAGLIEFSRGNQLSALSIVAVAGFGLAMLHPWPWIRRLLIPLGASRLAFAWARIGGPPWLRDPTGGAVLCGVLAMARKRRVDEDRLRSLELALGRAPLRGAGIVATGFIAALRKDRATAATILESVDDLDPDICPPIARTIAADWLVANAARRGRWHEVYQRSRDELAPSRTTRFMGTAAQRLLGYPIGRGALVRAWLVAPHRLATLQLAWRGWGARGLELEQVDAGLHEPPANGAGLLGTAATALHLETAQLSAAGAADVASLDRLARAWDQTLWNFDVRQRVRSRAFELECDTTVEQQVVELDRQICRDIGGMLPPGSDALGESRTLTRGVALHRDAQRFKIGLLLRELETAAKAEVSPSASTLWSVWVEIRDAYARAARGGALDERLATFEAAERHLGALVGWLWNDRRERALANAISFWLVCEADILDQHEVAEVHQPFVAAGP